MADDPIIVRGGTFPPFIDTIEILLGGINGWTITTNLSTKETIVTIAPDTNCQIKPGSNKSAVIIERLSARMNNVVLEGYEPSVPSICSAHSPKDPPEGRKVGIGVEIVKAASAKPQAT